MDSPGNSRNQSGHVHEVTGTGSMGGDVDRFDTPASTRAEETDGAWGSIAIAGAKVFPHTSLGAHAKGAPPE